MNKTFQEGFASPDNLEPQEKIFAISDKLRPVYIQFDKDVEQISEETFDNFEKFLKIIEELSSLKMTEIINSSLSNQATKQEDLKKVDTILLASKIVDEIEKSLSTLHPFIEQIKEKIKEARLDFDIQKSAGTFDTEGVIPKEIIDVFKHEAGKIGSGIHLLKIVLDSNIDKDIEEEGFVLENDVPEGTEKNLYLKAREGTLGSLMDEKWNEFNSERKKQEKNIEDLLKNFEQDIQQNFSLENPKSSFMTMYMLHASPNSSKLTSFSGSVLFSSMMRQDTDIFFSGEYDPENNSIHSVTYKDGKGGKTFTPKL